MFRTSDLKPALRVAIAAVLDEPYRFVTASDAELLSDVEAWESLGRLVDARRVAVAAEVERRSRKPLGEDGLAFRMGRRDGADLVRVLAKVGQREARRRVGLGAALASKLSLTGDELPGRFPSVAAAVRAGVLGIESARIVIDALQSVRKRAHADEWELGETGLTESACETDAESVWVHATEWKARLDPDGPGPSADEQHRERSLKIGRTGSDGITSVTARVPLIDLALLKAALHAKRATVAMTRIDAGGNETEAVEPQWIETEGEQRTGAQADYDALRGMLAAGIRAEQDGSGGSLRTPHEVIVQISAADAAARRGGGWAEGVSARLSVPVIEQVACSGGVRLLVTDETGEALHLGKPVRLFNAAQKKALAARFGGCAWPGCTAPVSWSDAHHIRWWKRDDGPTDIDNGVLLCSHHHHVIHAKIPGWRIVVHEREPYLVPNRWEGPPQPAHRMQRHPARLLPPPVDDDPWILPLTA